MGWGDYILILQVPGTRPDRKSRIFAEQRIRRCEAAKIIDGPAVGMDDSDIQAVATESGGIRIGAHLSILRASNRSVTVAAPKRSLGLSLRHPTLVRGVRVGFHREFKKLSGGIHQQLPRAQRLSSVGVEDRAIGGLSR
jgi:hypothetical protein